MKARIYLFTILLSFLITNRIHSQETSYIFRHIGATEGLPDNYIGSVFSIAIRRVSDCGGSDWIFCTSESF